MRNVSNHILLYFSMVFMATSCVFIDLDDDDDNDISIKGQGELVEREIAISDFSEISNIGVMDINVSFGDETSVTLKAQENLMDYITCETNGGELKLGVENNVSISTSKGMYADIVMQNSLENINIIGTGNITLAGEKQDNLYINIIGTGNVNAFGLEVDNCEIRSTGTGNCEVFVSESLTVYITGVGKVYFKGDPKIRQTIIGLGGVIDSN